MYVTCAVLLGFLLDWIFGDPQKLPHPICAVGKLVSLSEKLLRRIFPKTTWVPVYLNYNFIRKGPEKQHAFPAHPSASPGSAVPVVFGSLLAGQEFLAQIVAHPIDDLIADIP